MVEPENRLVARTLERRWEEALRQVRLAEEDYDRFRHEKAVRLSAGERELIEGLSQQVPALWEAASTTAAERKEIVRCLVERVVVSVQEGSEEVGIVIHWQGGATGTHATARPVQRTSDLRAGGQLLARVQELSGAGKTSGEIAEILNGEGFVPPRRQGPFTAAGVRQLLKRAGLVRPWRQVDELGKHEWWLADLADELAMAEAALRVWLRRGWVHGRQTAVQRLWVVWADREELRRLRRLRAQSHEKGRRVSPELKSPKPRR